MSTSSILPSLPSSTSGVAEAENNDRHEQLTLTEIASSSTIVTKDDSSNNDDASSLSSESSSISDDVVTSVETQARAEESDSTAAIKLTPTTSSDSSGNFMPSAPSNPPTSTDTTKEATKPPPKPQRPFTEYNIFFQLEREHLLQSMPEDSDGEKQGYTLALLALNNQTPETADVAALRPARYRQLLLPTDWYVVGCKGKRKHRKTHGAVTFVELTKRISKAWASVDPETKQFCGKLAKSELARYRGEMEVFIAKYGAEAAKGKRRKKVEVLAARAAAAREKQEKLEKKAREAAAQAMGMGMGMHANYDNMHMNMDMDIGGDGAFVPVDFEMDEVDMDGASLSPGRLPSQMKYMPSAKRQRVSDINNMSVSRPVYSPTCDDSNADVAATVSPEGNNWNQASMEDMLIAETHRRRKQRIMQQRQHQAMMMHRRRRHQFISYQRTMRARNGNDNSIPTINKHQLMLMKQQYRQQSQECHRQDDYEPPFDEEVGGFLNNFDNLLHACRDDNSHRHRRRVHDESISAHRALQPNNTRPSASPSQDDGECRKIWENLAEDDAKFQGGGKGMMGSEEAFAMLYLKKFHSKCKSGLRRGTIGSRNVNNDDANCMVKQEDYKPPLMPSAAW